MKSTTQIAQLLRAVHFGGNWTGVNLKETLADVTWQQATTRVSSMHSIAMLVFHMNYYIDATIELLQGGSLEADDEFSFDCPTLSSEQDWQRLLAKTWADAEQFATLIEALPDSQLSETFVEDRYGTYFRCFQGPVEHCHYHLGQIAMIKTLLKQQADSPPA